MARADLPTDAKRELLYGVLALQLNFVSREDLQVALIAWREERNRSLAQLLVEQQALPPRRRSLLDELFREYLSQYGMDVSRGLEAACAYRPIPADLWNLAMPTLAKDQGTLPFHSTLQAQGDGPPLAFPVQSARNRYRIVRPHARGALGQVFVAQDEELNREVALKEIQEPYANLPDSRARFILEAEITGSLEHPGVVPVYSLGAHADGRPFYTMRFIKGQSLHDAIENFHARFKENYDPSERALQLRGLLIRFIAVCNTIAYAHARGVIHRDIKPSNIMLGPYGETLVVDWGLAKAFDQPMTPDSMELPVHPQSSHSTEATMLGQAVGTPAFMPPEQAMGRVDLVGPASDVYSLGATLYNLLAGVPAFTGRAADVLKQVQRHSFPPPRQVQRWIPPPLEAIVLKAMAFHPEDRYATANQLASDLERWLADEPVYAYREPFLDRVSRWTRRHRTLVYATTVLMVTALIGLTVGLYAVNQERALTKIKGDIADRNLRFAQKAIKECFVVATENPQLQQSKMRGVRKELLEKALEFYKEARYRKPNDDSIDEDYADNQFRIAVILDKIGKKEEAIKAYQDARDIFKKLLHDFPEDRDYQVNLGRTLNNLGTLQSGHEAKQSYEQALQVREQLALQHPDHAEYQFDLAGTYINLGVLHRNDFHRTKSLLDQARLKLLKLVEKEPRNQQYNAALASAYQNLGELHSRIPETVPEALNYYKESLFYREKLIHFFPTNSDHRANHARTRLYLARLLEQEGLLSDALNHVEQALQTLEVVCKDEPEVIEFQIDQARALLAKGHLLTMHKEQFDQGIQLQRQAVGIFEKYYIDPIEGQIDQATAYVSLARSLQKQETRSLEARDWYTKAIALLEKLSSQQSEHFEITPLRMRAYWGLGELLTLALKEPLQGLAYLDKALKLTAPGDPEYNMIRRDRCFALAWSGNHYQAMQLAEELIQQSRGSAESRGTILFDMACVGSLSAQAASVNAQLAPMERTKLTERYVKLAIQYLEQARLLKFFDQEEYRSALREDKDLDFLRKYEGFQRLLNQVNQANKTP